MANEARISSGGTDTALEISGEIAEHEDCCCCPYTSCENVTCCGDDPTPSEIDVSLYMDPACCGFGCAGVDNDVYRAVYVSCVAGDALYEWNGGAGAKLVLLHDSIRTYITVENGSGGIGNPFYWDGGIATLDALTPAVEGEEFCDGDYGEHDYSGCALEVTWTPV